MNRSILESLKEFGSNNPITRAGEYWAGDNAEFEAGNPSTLARIGRAVNPMTSLGSAMGAMKLAAGKGDITDMGLAALQAMPLYGATKVVGPTMKEAAKVLPSLSKTGALAAADVGGSVTIDQIQSPTLDEMVLAAKATKKRT